MTTTTITTPEGGMRPTSLGGVAVVLASIALSLASYGVLPDEMRIRWSVGTYYGPEQASTLLVLGAFSVLVAVLYVGFHALRRALEGTDGFAEVSRAYEVVTLSTLGSVVLVQALLVVLNLL